MDPDDFDVDAAFAANLGVADEPADDEPKRPPEGAEGDTEAPAEKPDGESAPEGEGSEDGSEAPEGGNESEPKPEDDPEIELKVGDGSQKIKASELAKLVQQQAELQNRAQEAASAVEKANTEYGRAQAALGKMLEKANARFNEYKNLNFFLLAQQMEPQAFQQLQNDAQAAYEEVTFLQTELDGLVTQQRVEVTQRVQEQAQATLKELTDPEKGIPGFNQDVYSRMVDYAVSNGIPRDAALGIVDAPALRLIHKAMQFDAAAKTVQTRARPVAPASPARTVKPGSADASRTAPANARNKVINALRAAGGSQDAAVDAFYATLTADSE